MLDNVFVRIAKDVWQLFYQMFFQASLDDLWQALFTPLGISQVFVALLGFGAIWLATSKDEKSRKRASLLGLAGQPFWIYTALSTQTVGTFLITLGYTVIWARAVWYSYLSDRFKKK